MLTASPASPESVLGSAPAPARDDRAGRDRAWLAVGATAAVVVVSLLVRVVSRGDWCPGFDVVGMAHGLYLLSTRPSWDAIATTFAYSRVYPSPFPYYSAVCALLPGFLTSLWPWEHWSDVVTFACFGLTLWLLLRASELRARDAWIVLLAWSASSALLSLSITGFGWSTALLPHALALCVVCDRRVRDRWLLGLVLALVSVEVSWHVYELGKTVFLVYAVAAVVLRPVRWPTRLTWVAIAALQTWLVLRYPSSHAAAFSQIAVLSPAEIGARLAAVVPMLFSPSPYLDLPALVVAAAVACLVPSRRRVLLLAVLLVQVALVGVLALRIPGALEVRPRRFLMIDGYCLALVVSCLAETRGARGFRAGVRAAVIAILVAGSGWQMVDLVRFVRQPQDRQIGWGFTLPFVRSQVDYMIGYPDVDWTHETRARVDAGDVLLLVYDMGVYDENYTNPNAALERLYVHLGHRRFVDTVFAFGSSSCHHDCVPLHPMNELAPFLASVAAGTGPAPDRIVGYWVKEQLYDTDQSKADRTRALDEIRRRFTVTVETPDDAKYQRFRIAPPSPAS